IIFTLKVIFIIFSNHDHISLSVFEFGRWKPHHLVETSILKNKLIFLQIIMFYIIIPCS
ncbi:hypothetical protein ACJX0J_005452, partial [Zea mays]